MTRMLQLPEFNAAADAPIAEVTAPSPGAPAEDALAAFEKGYQSGWEDCLTAETEERGRIGADLAAALREAGAAYETARQDVLEALAPLLNEMTHHLLPRLAQAAFLPMVAEELSALAAQSTRAQIDIIAAPAAQGPLTRLIEQMPELEARIRTEPAFAGSQVSLRMGPDRRDLNLDEVSQRIAAVTDQFLADHLAGPAPAAAPTLPQTQGAA